MVVSKKDLSLPSLKDVCEQRLGLKPDGPPSKVRRMGLVTTLGFGIASAVAAALMGGGFWAFGDRCDGFILNNFPTSDRLAQLARAGFTHRRRECERWTTSSARWSTRSRAASLAPSSS